MFQRHCTGPFCWLLLRTIISDYLTDSLEKDVTFEKGTLKKIKNVYLRPSSKVTSFSSEFTFSRFFTCRGPYTVGQAPTTAGVQVIKKMEGYPRDNPAE